MEKNLLQNKMLDNQSQNGLISLPEQIKPLISNRQGRAKIQDRVFKRNDSDYDLGPKEKCSMCKNIFYKFEMTDHIIACIKIKKQKDIKVKMMKKQPQKQIQPSHCQNQKVEIVQKVDQQTKKLIQNFEIKKQQISKIIQIKKSRLEKKQQALEIDEIIQFPCPFCGLKLSLKDLDHVEKCIKGIECRHCKDRFPIQLHYFHLIECPVWNNKQKNKKKEQKEKINSNRNCPENKPSQKYIKKSKSRKQMLNAIINPYELDSQSLLRAKELKGVPKSILNNLKRTKCNLSQNELMFECAICLQNFQQGQMVISLSCKHVFDEFCLFPWLQNHTVCPICKKRVQ